MTTVFSSKFPLVFLWVPLTIFVLFVTAVVFRPLFPIDETRYMSVAWEMYLHDGWLSPLTKNFEPYHHKPPLLFWLINGFWSVFGVSRWAGTIVPVLASFSCILLAAHLGTKILSFGRNNPRETSTRIMLVFIGTLPFLIYGTLVMFDFLLCAFTLLAIIFLLRYADDRKTLNVLGVGLSLGMGILAKGPVALLYVLPLYLLAPVWKADLQRRKNWYLSLIPILCLAALPVLLWLIPILQSTDNQFAFWLVWNQTAGRVTGNFSEAHVRPFYFYLPLLPLFIFPWVLFPSFWRGLTNLKANLKSYPELYFLACWFVPVFVAFSLISGKQPHYMVPLVPALVLFLVFLLKSVTIRTLVKFSFAMVILVIGGQVVASRTVFRSYDLMPIAEKINTISPSRPLAFVSNYHAELGFLARLTTRVHDTDRAELEDWFKTNPEGWAVVKYKSDSDIKPHPVLMTMPYRGGRIALLGK